jgi:cyanuric acid amidohydrolase
MRAQVFRLSMAHPGDLSELEALFVKGALQPQDVVAVIGKTEGNGGVNDFTRGYFTQSLMALLSRRLDEPADALAKRIPCVLSGGCEGVLSPHYVVLTVSAEAPAATADAMGSAAPALALGTAISTPVPAWEVGRAGHIRSVASAVRAAMAKAQIADQADVHLVQVKCPCLTAARAEAAKAQGQTVATSDPDGSMALARAAGAFGVALALGEVEASAATEEALLRDRSVWSARASVSSGVEVEANEVIVLGNSRRWSGPLAIAHRPMRDALDIGGVVQVLADLGIAATPQVAAEDGARVAAVLVKCEPDRRGQVRGQRHTMLDDTDIDAQRHIRGAVGGLVAGVLGDTRIFVSGGAEHQGPDGGGLIAVIAERADPGRSTSCAS